MTKQKSAATTTARKGPWLPGRRGRRGQRGGWAVGALALGLARVGQAWAGDVALVGVGTLAGDASDGLELEPPVIGDATGRTMPHDRAGGWGSAIAYTGVGNLYFATPDRGPFDGDSGYLDRAYLLDIAVRPGTAAPVSVKPVRATTLTNERGELLTGAAKAFDATNSAAGLRFDPEGTRLSGDGTFFVSDEYGPFLYEFSPAGERLGVIGLPGKLAIAAPHAIADTELRTNTSGRQANRGMEGLAISPDGTKLYGLMQNPLIQDGGLDAAFKRVGLNVRLIEIDRATGKTRELVYVLDTKGNGLNEILAINDHEFLVIERDGDAGLSAKRKLIYKIDITGASDVSDVASLPVAGLPSGVQPVKKSLLIDLLADEFGLKGETFPEKIEGLAFGPPLPDGRRTLIVTSDNDFVAEQPSRAFVFALGPDALGSYQPQTLRPHIDVMPLSGRNVIEPGRPGVVPVAVFGTALLPVSALDWKSLTLGGAPVIGFGPKQQLACARVDLDDDGELDLVCAFDQRKVALPAGARSIELAATTSTGTPVRAIDAVVVRR